MKTRSKQTIFMINIWLCAGMGLLLPTALLSPSTSLAQAHTLMSQVQTQQHVADPAPAELRHFAEMMVQRLSQTEPFSDWKDVQSTIEPLGPGTRSWLVTVKPGHTASGYLIISVTDDGEYKLIEYGIGPESLYTASTLQTALQELRKLQTGQALTKLEMKVVPVYAGPALAQWKISAPDMPNQSELFLSAATGEVLPENLATWGQQAASYTPPLLAAGSRQQELTPENPVYTAPCFDPYDNIMWMTQSALNIKKHPFEQLLKASKRLLFIASGPKRTHSIPLPIIGYQKWQSDDSAMYVLTGTSSSRRWIALNALTDAGYFVAYEDGDEDNHGELAYIGESETE